MDTDGRRVDKILITRENLDSEVKHLTPPEEPVA
jgi:hypothetical protein